MAEAWRREEEWDADRADAAWVKAQMAHDPAARPGGPVGQMQADLVRRLVREAPGAPVATAGEHLVRALSVGGGWLALLAGYGGAALLVLR